MHRQWIIASIALLALAASACGGAQTPDAAAPGEAECVTPPGASAENPPDCGAGCEWKPATLKCEPKRGIIVEDQAPTPPPPPSPPE